MHRSKAQQIVRAIKAPVPTHEGGTLYVEGVPADQWDDREFIRVTVARYALRYALEKGCTRIVVRHPHRDPIAFDVVDLIQRTVRLVGYYPRPRFPGVPANLATMGFRARGAEMDRVRTMVPVAFTPTPVCGLDPAGQEG